MLEVFSISISIVEAAQGFPTPGVRLFFRVSQYARGDFRYKRSKLALPTMTPKQNATSPTLVGRFLLSHAVVFFFHNQAPERRSGVLGGRSTSQIPFQAKSYTAVCPFPHINLPASQLRSNILLFFSPFIFPPRLFASSPHLVRLFASPRLASYLSN